MGAVDEFANNSADKSVKRGALLQRVSRARSAYRERLEKPRPSHQYEFGTWPTVVLSDEEASPLTNIEALPLEDLDIHAQVNLEKETDHSVPTWLTTIAGYSWRLLLVSAAIALVVFALSHVRMVIISIFIALVLTSVLRPLRNVFDRHMKRGLSVLCTMVTGFLIVGVLLAFVIISVAGNWASLGSEFTSGVGRLFEMLQEPPLNLHLPFENVHEALTAGQTWIGTHYADIIGQAGHMVEWIVYIALAIFLTVFFLSSGRQMWQWLLAQLPEKARSNLTKAFSAGFTTFAGYARGLVLIGLIDGILAAILLFALGIPLAAPLAVLVFIGSFIEMIGAPAAMVIAGVVALATRGPVRALLVMLGVALIGQIEGHLLQPFIMGRQVKLHPVVVALAVATGTVVAGIMGAILTVPIVAVTWSIFKILRPKPGIVPPPQLTETAIVSAHVTSKP